MGRDNNLLLKTKLLIQEEIFARIEWLITNDESSMSLRLLYMHETLVLLCHEGVKETRQNFGNLFAQVDFLCRKHNISVADTIEIQTARRHSNGRGKKKEGRKEVESLSNLDIHYDCRAISILASAVFCCDIPSNLAGKIPVEGREKPAARHIDYQELRCIVVKNNPEDRNILVSLEDGDTMKLVNISEAHAYLHRMVTPDMMLSLTDIHEEENGTLSPRFIVIEPDYLLDISSVAGCFKDYGHHPLSYMVNQMKPAANSQAIMLGNYAGAFLDDCVHGDASWDKTLKEDFSAKALSYVMCPDFNGTKYKEQCKSQAENIRSIVAEIKKHPTSNTQGQRVGLGINPSPLLLEPSFVCPALGLQGRVDMMSEDMLYLVEQKAGNNYNLANHIKDKHGAYQQEHHYVQLLLYFAILHQNFNIPINKLDIRLMYSRYPLPDGLLVVNYYQQLLQEALMVRNRVVASAMNFAREGFSPRYLKALTSSTLNENKIATSFYKHFEEPQLNDILAPLHNLSPLEEAYFCRMTSFCYLEQAISCIGAQEGTSRGKADIWNMPFSEKMAQGQILTGRMENEERKMENSTEVTILRTDNNEVCFRQGDSVYLYRYHNDEEPDATKAILYKCSIVSLEPTKVTLHLMDPQPLSVEQEDNMWAVEQSYSSSGVSSGLRALHMLSSAPKDRRDLLLGQRQPRFDTSVSLSRSYHPSYDDVLLKAKQAQDYFLLVGPPGTGKTSMAMQFMVKENLSQGCILLTSYTNRAIDEICEMLTDNDIEFLRIGNPYTCDPRYHHRLAGKVFSEIGSLGKARQYLTDVKVVVATTMTLMNTPQLFDIKTFSLTIVDEASQILEPNIIGLLSRLGKFILIGDHKQLPAVVQQTEQDSQVTDPLLQEIGLTNCRNSLFERLIKMVNGDIQSLTPNTHQLSATLHYQGRMHPEVAAWPNKMFYKDDNIQPVPLPHQKELHLEYYLPSQDELDDKLKSGRMLFFDVRKENVEGDTDLKSNETEAHLCADIVCRLKRQLGENFNPQKSIGIIVPYRNQISLIKKQLEKNGITDDITIDTVERYQGSQRDVIIFSFTVSQRHQLEFLTGNTVTLRGKDGYYEVDRKLNVALTRARKQMIMIGNAQLLSQNKIYRELCKEFLHDL